jgi:hypothetical protein
MGKIETPPFQFFKFSKKKPVNGKLKWIWEVELVVPRHRVINTTD